MSSNKINIIPKVAAQEAAEEEELVDPQQTLRVK